MATIQQTEGGEFVVVPTGEYEGYVDSITPGTSTFDGKEQPNLKFVFVLLGTDDGEGNPVQLFGWTSQIFSQHEKCKLMAWSKAIFKKSVIPASYVLDTDDLIGRPVVVVVNKYTSADGVLKNKVSELLPSDEGGRVEVARPADEEEGIPF